jgi:fused signal recognition particle receptor
MFDSLKKKLQNIRTKFASNIEEAAGAELEQPVTELPEGAEAVESGVTPAPPVSGEVPEKEREKPTFFKKVKVLVQEREVLLREKDIEEPRFELEMVLLENDVALPDAKRSRGAAEEDRLLGR